MGMDVLKTVMSGQMPDTEVLAILASRILGLSIVFMSMIIKLPQVSSTRQESTTHKTRKCVCVRERERKRERKRERETDISLSCSTHLPLCCPSQ